MIIAFPVHLLYYLSLCMKTLHSYLPIERTSKNHCILSTLIRSESLLGAQYHFVGFVIWPIVYISLALNKFSDAEIYSHVTGNDIKAHKMAINDDSYPARQFPRFTLNAPIVVLKISVTSICGRKIRHSINLTVIKIKFKVDVFPENVLYSLPLLGQQWDVLLSPPHTFRLFSYLFPCLPSSFFFPSSPFVLPVPHPFSLYPLFFPLPLSLSLSFSFQTN